MSIDWAKSLQATLHAASDIASNPLAQELLMLSNPALGTLSRLNTVVSQAKDGNPAAVETVKEVKARSTLGDPVATEAVKTMAVISKAQDIKARKTRGSLYARGAVSIGHDPITFGAVRDQRGGAGGGGGVTVTSVPRGTLRSAASRDARGATGTVVTDQRGGKTVTYYGAPAARNVNTPYAAWATPNIAAPIMVKNAAGKPMLVSQFPTTLPTDSQDPYGQGASQDPYADPYADPYGQGASQDPYGQGYPQDPYGGQYGGYPQYPQYPQYDPYGAFYGQPYGLQGLPPGYGYEEPIVDKGGFQQYDPDTDSFFSSNQKQVYDEETGMFMPAPSYNPYAL